VVDPRTGQSVKKTTLGGAYPGQRRPQQAPHVPAASEFNGPNGTATAHFISYGRGTALTLVRPNGDSAPAVGPSVLGDAKLPQYVQGTSFFVVANFAGDLHVIALEMQETIYCFPLSYFISQLIFL